MAGAGGQFSPPKSMASLSVSGRNVEQRIQIEKYESDVDGRVSPEMCATFDLIFQCFEFDELAELDLWIAGRRGLSCY